MQVAPLSAASLASSPLLVCSIMVAVSILKVLFEMLTKANLKVETESNH